MKQEKTIVVLDGYTLNPGDLDWGGLQQLGNVQIHDRVAESEILKVAQNAEILLSNKTVISADHIQQLPKLEYIGVLATGYNVIDIEAASKSGIIVTNIPEYGTHSVAQMVIALLLELCHRVQYHSDAVKNGKWAECPDFCFWESPLVGLSGKIMGIIGFGRIGQQIGKIASAMGMQILGFSRTQSTDVGIENFQWADTSTIFQTADVISLNCPLTHENQGMINQKTLGMMKKSAFLINASRGGLIQDHDLAQALETGVIAGAALDVLSVEPPEPDNPLYAQKNCLITPHIAWATFEARQRLMQIAIENVQAFLNGNPVNCVSL